MLGENLRLRADEQCTWEVVPNDAPQERCSAMPHIGGRGRFLRNFTSTVVSKTAATAQTRSINMPLLEAILKGREFMPLTWRRLFSRARPPLFHTHTDFTL
jgi:hypothetical protein